MAKRGRPRGLHLNTVAFLEALDRECVSKAEIAEVGGIKATHLSDALYRQKGVSRAAVKAMAGRLRVKPETIAPELTQQFIAILPDDDRDDVLAQGALV